MSASVSLQDILIALLKGSDDVKDIVGARIFDGVPSTATFPYVSLGASEYVPADTDCIAGRQETVQIDCWSQDKGRVWPCKALVDAVKAALHDADVDDNALASGAVASLSVERTRVFIEPDNKTAHGLVQVTAVIEEPT